MPWDFLCGSSGAISKDLNNNGGGDGYDPETADRRAEKLQREAHVHCRYSEDVWEKVEDRRGSISDQRWIDERPAAVDRKERFGDLTREEVKRIEWKLNNRPRKRLGFLTPLEYISRRVRQIYLTT